VAAFIKRDALLPIAAERPSKKSPSDQRGTATWVYGWKVLTAPFFATGTRMSAVAENWPLVTMVPLSQWNVVPVLLRRDQGMNMAEL